MKWITEKIRVMVLVAVSAAVLSSCSGDSGQDGATDAAEPGSRLVSGVAAKGPITGADIEIYRLNGQGARTTLVASTTTNNNGVWSVTVPAADQSRTLLVVSSGGDFVDESDTEPDPALKRRIALGNNDELLGILFPGETTASITLVTHALIEKSRAEETTGDFLNLLNNNRDLAVNSIGFNPFVVQAANPLTPAPASSEQSVQYAMYLGGLANALNSVSIALGQAAPDYNIMLGFISDISDGMLDGQKNGSPVEVVIDSVTMVMPSTIDLNQAIERYRNNNWIAYREFQDIPTPQVNEAELSTPLANRPPSANSDSGIVTSEITLVTTPNVLNNDSDPDGDSFSITSFDNTVPGGVVTNNGNGTFNFQPAPGFTGNYIFSYTITDSNGKSDSANVTISVIPSVGGGGGGTNIAPTANAGTDQTVNELTVVNLDGSASSDLDGMISTYSWSQVPGPGPLVSLIDATTATPSFTAPDVASNSSVVLRLTVVDDGGQSDSDTVTININNISSAPPTANAGSDQGVNEQTTVNLDATGSMDDIGISSYSWNQISGTMVSLSNNSAPTPSFTAPVVSVGRVDILVFQLTVSDANANTDIDTVSIFVNPVNPLPVADAGTDQTVNESTLVNLSAAGSTDDGSIASYAWNQTAGPMVSLSNTAVAAPSFTGPDVNGDQVLTFELTVTDNEGGTDTDTVNITLSDIGGNVPPVAVNDVAVTTQNTLVTTVDVTANDIDLDGPSALSVVSVGQPINGSVVDNGDNTFDYTPNNGYVGLDTFTYTVTDGSAATAIATVTVTVNGAANTPPTADAGVDQNVDEQITVNLTGAGNDPDGSIASYAWSQVSGVNIGTITNANAQNASFTAPTVMVGSVEALVLQLTVTDNGGATGNDFVTVIVNPVNPLPVADAGTDQTLNEQLPVNLDASGSSDDGAIVSYSWMQTAGTLVSLNNGNTATPDFTGPDILNNETLTFEVTVTDDEGGVSTDTVDINLLSLNAAPIANNDGPIAATEDISVQITVASLLANDTDADSPPPAFNNYTQPANGTITGPSAGVLTYTSDLNYNGPDSFTYTIIDDQLAVSAAATVDITVAGDNDDPVANADTASTNQDTSVVINDALLNDTDVEGNFLQIVAVNPTGNQGGSVINNGDGSSITYIPPPGFTGDEDISYTINDGAGGSDTGTITVTVLADTDGDGITDVDETAPNPYATNPGNPDTDSDGFYDQHELAAGTDPTDPFSFPAPTVISDGNGNNTISSDTTWNLAGSPYWLRSDTTVEAGVTLTIEAGVVIKSDSNVDLDVLTGATLNTEGKEPVPQRVLFTSSRDDSVNGDTNGDGVGTTPSANNWYGLEYRQNANGSVKNTDIFYANYCLEVTNASPIFDGMNIGDCQAYAIEYSTSSNFTHNFNFNNINIYDVDGNGRATESYGVYVVVSGTSTLVMNANDISIDRAGSHSSTYSFYMQGSGGSIGGNVSNLVITNATSQAIRVANNGAGDFTATFTNIDIDTTATNAMEFTATSSGSVAPVFDGTISTTGSNSNNSAVVFTAADPDFLPSSTTTIDGGFYGLNLNNSTGDYRNITTTNSTTSSIILQAGAAPDTFSNVDVDSLSPFTINGQSLPANVVAGTTFPVASGMSVRYGGTVVTNSALGSDPLGTGTSVWDVYTTLTVGSGVTLTITDNAILKFQSGVIMYVDGTLDVAATVGNEAIFTSYRDDVLADTNGDGASTPARNDWSYIQARANSVLDIDNAIIRHNSIGIYSTSAQIDLDLFNVAFSEHNQHAIYGYNFGASTVTIENVSVDGTNDTGIYAQPDAGDSLSYNINGLTLSNIGNGNGTDRALWFEVQGSAAVFGNWFDITINTVNAGGGIYIFGTGTGVIDPVLSGITVNGPLGSGTGAILFSGGGSQTRPVIDDRVAINNLNAGGYGLWLDDVAGSYSDINIDSSAIAAIGFTGGASPTFWEDASIVLSNLPSPFRLRSELPTTVGTLGTADTGYTDGGGLNLAYVEIDGSLSDTVLVADPLNTGSSVYYAPSSFSIAAGQTLTMQPNAILKVADGRVISVYGTLDMAGSNGNLAIITGIRDDVFADTNGDGTATLPAQGNWAYIQTLAGGALDLDYAMIRYAQYGLYTVNAAVDIDVNNSQVIDQQYDAFYASNLGNSTIDLVDTTFDNIGISHGIYMNFDNGDAITLNMSNLTVSNVGNASNDYGIDINVTGNATVTGAWSNVSVSNIAGHGLNLLDDSTGDVTPVISGLSISGTLGANSSALRLDGNSTTKVTVDGSVGTNNLDTGGYGLVLLGVAGDYADISIDGSGIAAIFMSENPTPTSWDDASIIVDNSPTPYSLRNNLPATVGSLASSDLGFTPGVNQSLAYVEIGGTMSNDITLLADPLNTGTSVWYVRSQMNVPAGMTLSLGADAILKMADVGIDVYGTLETTSTAGNEATITAFSDDLLADTNGDGAATSPGPGSWLQLRSFDGANIELTSVDIYYGDYGLYQTNASSSLILIDVSMIDNNFNGIYATNMITTSLYIRDVTITGGLNDGIYLGIDASDAVTLDIDGLVIDNIGNTTNDEGIEFNTSSTGGLTGTVYNVTISNVTGGGILLNGSGTGVVTPVFSGITINPTVGTNGFYMIGVDPATNPTLDNSSGNNNFITGGNYAFLVNGIAGNYSNVTADGGSISTMYFSNGAEPQSMTDIVLINSVSPFTIVNQGMPTNINFDSTDVTNVNDYVNIRGVLTQDTTLNADPLGTGSSWYQSTLDLQTGANHLTIAAGTVMKFDPGIYLEVDSGGSIDINGALLNEVVMTSTSDDRADVLDGNPAGSSADDRDWGGLWFKDGSVGGTISHFNSYFAYYGVYYEDAVTDASFNDVLLSNAYEAIYFVPGSLNIAPSFNNLEIEDPRNIGIYFVTTSAAVQYSPIFTGSLTINDTIGVTGNYCIYNQSPSLAINISGWEMTGCNTGIYLSGSIGGTYANNLIRSANTRGIYINSSTPLTVSDNVIVNNGNPGNAGTGIYVVNLGSSSVIENNLLRGNSSAYGAMMFTGTNGSVTVRNNLIVENTASSVSLPAGVYLEDSSTIDFYNNTIADNTAAGASNIGVGLQIGSSSNAITYHDNIIFNNSDTDSVSEIEDLSGGSTAFNNFTSDPLFDSGWYLNPVSTAIDAGSALASALGFTTETTQILGTADAGTVDIGYHYTAGVAFADGTNSQGIISSTTTTQNVPVTLTIIPRDNTPGMNLLGPALDVSVSAAIPGHLGSIIDNGDGTYTTTYTPITLTGSDTLIISVNGNQITDQPTVTW